MWRWDVAGVARGRLVGPGTRALDPTVALRGRQRWRRRRRSPQRGGDGADDSPCSGRLLHTDRYPGSLLQLTSWHDEYVVDTCGASVDHDIHLPEIPWGERPEPEDNLTVVYDEVRHPYFPERDTHR